jgi:hypothetical protein
MHDGSPVHLFGLYAEGMQRHLLREQCVLRCVGMHRGWGAYVCGVHEWQLQLHLLSQQLHRMWQLRVLRSDF